MAGTEETPDSTRTSWGRVAEDGTVYVREASGEREVGAFPDATPEEALAYFERKFTELAGQVNLLEQRIKHGAPAKDVAKAVTRLSENVRGANAVGDLESLTQRLSALGETAEKLTEQQSAEARAAVEKAIVERTKIVEDVEKLAAENPEKVQWKKTSQAMDALFADWQSLQQNGPRLPSSNSQELWRRFRTARSTIEYNRRAFFAELDMAQRDARGRKEKLIEQADALASKGADAIPAYRALLDKWKTVGRAGRRYDDELWEQFKKAGDVLYDAQAEIDIRDNKELEENLTLKIELLDAAEPILTETDRERARTALLSLQRRWDKIGKVPRNKTKTVEDRLRAIETVVRRLDENHWRTNNPEKRARSEGMVNQLQDSIRKLESELDEAKKSGNQQTIAKAEEALAARRQWLAAIDQ